MRETHPFQSSKEIIQSFNSSIIRYLAEGSSISICPLPVCTLGN